MDSLQLLIRAEEGETKPQDKIFLFDSKPENVSKLPAGQRGLPDWAPKSAKNLRGVCEVNTCHYSALACINNCFLEVLLDSGGGKTMIDKQTAIALGLDIEWADPTKNFLGSF